MTDDQPQRALFTDDEAFKVIFGCYPGKFAPDGGRVRASLPGFGQEVTQRDWSGRPWRELSESGLLWLINATCFHPRGYALALSMDTRTGEVTGWDILGDGTEPWSYADPVDDRFRAAEATLASHRAPGGGDPA